jgi:RHS repeat-associated protein
MTDRKLGNTAGASELWRLQNGFPSTGNNGNIESQTLTLLAGTPIETYYEYDGVNRLEWAVEEPSSTPTCPDAGSHWCQLYDYDARGNRAVDDESNLSFVIGRPSTFGTDNRIADNGFDYDDRGNLLLLDSNERYLYDGENRQITYCPSTVSEANCEDTGYTTGKTFYGYDGEGRRVLKTNTAGTEVFVYDALGRLAAEYGGTVDSAATRYITTDHLGSTRIITDASRTVVECRDYLPFGDEVIASSQNGRDGISCYTQDLTRQKFTGYERDSESRLDFAQARYYSWAGGRFQSPDSVAGSTFNPQTLNLYVYVWNNPLRHTDPTGLVVSWEDSKKKCKQDDTDCRTDLQRKYEDTINRLLNSKNEKDRERGQSLQETYQRLQDAKETFHVVRTAGGGTGELTYRGEAGHLYVELQGGESGITNLQRLGHEFKHGEQFLDGLLGFAYRSDIDRWQGFRDDLVDEANAFIAGFAAEPVNRNQNEFLQGLGRAAGFGVNEVVNTLNRPGNNYYGRSATQLPITYVSPIMYGVPRTR